MTSTSKQLNTPTSTLNSSSVLATFCTVSYTHLDVYKRQALKGYTEGATVLIVAQRVSTIMHAEQIVVLDEGRVMGIGTHRELSLIHI